MAGRGRRRTVYVQEMNTTRTAALELSESSHLLPTSSEIETAYAFHNIKITEARSCQDSVSHSRLRRRKKRNPTTVK